MNRSEYNDDDVLEFLATWFAMWAVDLVGPGDDRKFCDALDFWIANGGPESEHKHRVLLDYFNRVEW